MERPEAGMVYSVVVQSLCVNTNMCQTPGYATFSSSITLALAQALV